MKKILIAGGTGLVGTRLSEILSGKGYEVCHLSRSKKQDGKYKVYQWDLRAKTIEPEALEGTDIVINLAGAGIANKPWTSKRKALIMSSRIEGNLLLAQEIVKYDTVKAYLSASAIGYYGDRPSTELLSEESSPGKNGFLAESVIAWENAIAKVGELGIRTALVRIGIVLSTKGGALEKMLLPLKFGIGSYFGSGEQVYSWIHIEDLCRIFVEMVENDSLGGVYNGVAPVPVSNKKMMQEARGVFNSFSLLLPVPEFLLRIVMGEMADVVYSGSKVSSKKIEETGFKFKFPSVGEALVDLKERRW